MKPLFFKVLFYRYMYNTTQILKVVGYLTAIALLLLNAFAVYGFFFNHHLLPSFMGFSTLWSTRLVYTGMGANMVSAFLLIRDYFVDAIKYRTMDLDQWPKKTPSTSKYMSHLETMCMMGGFIGVIAGFVLVLVFVILGKIQTHLLNPIFRGLGKGISHLAYNLTHAQEIMEAKNQKFLENHPEQAAKIFAQELHEKLPEAQGESTPNRL